MRNLFFTKKVFCMKNLFFILIITSLMMLTFVNALAKTVVEDEAGLFSASEISALEQQLAKMQSEHDMNFVLITTDDVYNTDIETFAEKHYNGYTASDSTTGGVILLIDINARDVHLRGFHGADKKLSDSAAGKILDSVTSDLSAGRYYDATEAILSKVDAKLNSSLGIWFYIISAIIALLIALLVCFLVKKSYSSTKKQQTAQYLDRGSINYTLSTDTFVGTHTSVVKINTNSGGSGGSSGGGSRGATRKF